jgi:hypothetical protein
MMAAYPKSERDDLSTGQRRLNCRGRLIAMFSSRNGSVATAPHIMRASNKAIVLGPAGRLIGGLKGAKFGDQPIP